MKKIFIPLLSLFVWYFVAMGISLYQEGHWEWLFFITWIGVGPVFLIWSSIVFYLRKEKSTSYKIQFAVCLALILGYSSYFIYLLSDYSPVTF